MDKKRTVLYLALMLTASMSLDAQNSKRLFIGIQPDITREIKDNEEKIFSVNVLPLVAQVYLNEFSGIRISPILNLDHDSKELSNVGTQLVFPVYFLVIRSTRSSGVYASPVLGFSHNRRSGGNELTLAIEPGYSWIFANGFSMNLGLQLGGTNFLGGTADTGWRNHAGLKFSLGYTFLSN
jgi:hypothetical protein